jgi:hypothetical protein
MSVASEQPGPGPVDPAPVGWAEGLGLAGFSALFLAGGVVHSLRQPLWGDEVLMYYNTKASGFSELWWLLTKGGVEVISPVYPVLVWPLQRLLGEASPLALRLPALLGFLVFCLCVYRLARRRNPMLVATIAMLTPAVCYDRRYAYCGRPYGIVLALMGCALVCWQAAAAAGPGSRRRPALLGLAASLFALVTTHLYAVIFVAPFALAEAVRMVTSRRARPDWAVLAALAVAAVPLAFQAPLIATGMDIAKGAGWLRFTAYDVRFLYNLNFEKTLFPIVLGVGLLLAWPRTRVQRPAALTPPEVGLMLGLLGLPVIGGVVYLIVKTFAARYVLPYLAGYALLYATIGRGLLPAAWQVGARGKALALAAMLLVGGVWAATALRASPALPEAAVVARFAAEAQGLGKRLVVLHGDSYLQYMFHLDPATADRVTVLDTNEPMHRRIFGNIGAWCRRKGLRFDNITVEGFLERPDAYLVLGTGDQLSRLYSLMPGPGSVQRMLGQDGGWLFVAFQPPGPSPATAPPAAASP